MDLPEFNDNESLIVSAELIDFKIVSVVVRNHNYSALILITQLDSIVELVLKDANKLSHLEFIDPKTGIELVDNFNWKRVDIGRIVATTKDPDLIFISDPVVAVIFGNVYVVCWRYLSPIGYIFTHVSVE